MNISNAKEIVDKYGYNASINEDEEFLLMEDLEYLIKGSFYFTIVKYDFNIKAFAVMDDIIHKEYIPN